MTGANDADLLVQFLRTRYSMAAQCAAALPHAIANMQSIWRPDRLLADADAKLRIVKHVEDILAEPLPDDDGARSFAKAARADAMYVLQLLALPYADHKDYRAGWAP